NLLNIMFTFMSIIMNGSIDNLTQAISCNVAVFTALGHTGPLCTIMLISATSLFNLTLRFYYNFLLIGTAIIIVVDILHFCTICTQLYFPFRERSVARNFHV
ncbi:hypothetical protein L9F63_005481, partial [Diploptera punctata]